jgi:hypothetical protein
MRPEGLGKLTNHLIGYRTRDLPVCSIVPSADLVQWSEFLATDPEVRVRFLALTDFLKSNWSGTGSTQPREYN